MSDVKSNMSDRLWHISTDFSTMSFFVVWLHLEFFRPTFQPSRQWFISIIHCCIVLCTSRPFPLSVLYRHVIDMKHRNMVLQFGQNMKTKLRFSRMASAWLLLIKLKCFETCLLSHIFVQKKFIKSRFCAFFDDSIVILCLTAARQIHRRWQVDVFIINVEHCVCVFTCVCIRQSVCVLFVNVYYRSAQNSTCLDCSWRHLKKVVCYVSLISLD